MYFKRFLFIVTAFVLITCKTVDIHHVADTRTLQQRCFTGQVSFDRESINYGRLCLDSLCCRSFEGRKAGTAGWWKAYGFLKREIQEMGYAIEEQVFYTENDTEIRNIIITIPGLQDSTIVVGAHMDGAVQSSASAHYPAANDNGSGTVAQLLLLKDLSQEVIITDRTIKVIFWGCEEVFEEHAFRGSLYYTHMLSGEEKKVMLMYINIDTVGHQLDENVVSLNHSGEARVEAAALNTSHWGHFNYAVSKRVTNLVSDYYSFFAIGIPYLNFHDHCQSACSNRLHTMNDIPEAVSIGRLYKVSQDIKTILKTY